MARTTIPAELVAINAIQGTLIADNAITAVHIATNAVSGTLVADNAITSTHIAQNNVTATQIAQNTITVTQMADSAIETAKINNDAVTQAKIADDAVGPDQLAANAVVSASIANGTIIEADMADNAVTLAKMASLARGKIIVGDSAGDPSALAIGSNGTVLSSDGTDVSWAAAAGTTINNNADNRVITGSGTANTLEGESGLTYDGDTLQVQSGGNNRFKVNNSGTSVESGHLYFNPGTGSLGNKYVFVNGGTSADGGFILQRNNANQWQIAPDPGSDDDLNFYSYGTNSTVLRIDRSSGQVNFGAGLGIGGTGAANTLDDYEEGTWTPAFYTYSGVTTTTTTTGYGIYTKIGRMVYIHAKLHVTLSSLPGQIVTITGLPFAGLNATTDAGQRAIFVIGGDAANVGSYGNGRAHFRLNNDQLQGVWMNSGSTSYWYYNSMDSTTFKMNIHGHYAT